MRLQHKAVQKGDVIATRPLDSLTRTPAVLPDLGAGRLTHLQFRRFAGCPVCNLHLRSVVARHAEIEAAGITEVVVFHSPPDELSRHVADMPFAVVADPDRRLYMEFGVESSRRSLLDPRVWLPIARAVLTGLWQAARGREHFPARRPHGGRLGLPADFLIDAEGRVLAAGYGEHAYDQWPVDHLLALAAGRHDDEPATVPDSRR